MQRLLLFLNISLAAVNLNAQYRFDNPVHLGVVDGLPNEYVNCFAEDSYGFIWIGTHEGLCRFDGSRLIVYNKRKSDSTFLPDNSIRSLLINGDTLWIGTTQGLSRMNIKTRHFQNFRFQSEYPGLTKDQQKRDHINALYKDRQGEIWIAPTYNEIVKWDQTSKRFIKYSLPKARNLPEVIEIGSYTSIRGFYQDINQDSILWAITGADLIRFNKINGQAKRIRFSYEEDSNIEYDLNSFKTIYQHTDGKIYLGVWQNGLIIYDPERDSFYVPKLHSPDTWLSELNDVLLEGIYPMDDNELYLTFSKGIFTYNISSKEFKKIRLNNFSPSAPHLSGIKFIDSQNRIWLNSSLGVFMFDQMSQQYACFPFSGLSKLSFRPVPRDAIEGFYPGYISVVGNNMEGVYHVSFEKNDLIVTPPPKAYLADNEYFQSWGIVRISEDELLIDGSQKLFYFKRGMQEMKPFKWQPNLKYSGFSNLALGHDGKIWQGSFLDSLWSVDLNSGAINKPVKNLPSGNITGVFVDNLGNVWSLIPQGHMAFTPGTGKSYSFQYAHTPDVTFERADQFCQCANGELWLSGHSEGIGLLDPDHPEKGIIRKIILKDDSREFPAYLLACDSKNNLWVMSYEHLLMVDRHNNWQVTAFSHQYGVSDVTTLFKCIKNDKLLIGAYDAICMVDPYKLVKNTQLTIPYVAEISTNKEREFRLEDLLQKAPVSLAAGENVMTVNFSSINHTLPHLVRYKYMLEGVNDNWIDPGNNRSVTYFNLDGGDYTFKLMASNNEGDWSEAYKLPVHVGTPWYKTYWFYLLLTLSISGLIYAFYRYRIMQVRKEEKLRSEFDKKIAGLEMDALRAQMNPHFIFNCLNSIDYYIIRSEIETASDYLNRFSRLIRLILQNSRGNLVGLKKELEALELYIVMEQMRFSHSFDYEISMDESLEPEKYEIPPMLIQPFVENAILHGLQHKEGKGKVSVVIRVKDNLLQCEIEDNGIGRKAAQKIKESRHIQRKSMGMNITSERIGIINKLHNTENKVDITDLFDDHGNPAGTRVTINIPVS